MKREQIRMHLKKSNPPKENKMSWKKDQGIRITELRILGKLVMCPDTNKRKGQFNLSLFLDQMPLQNNILTHFRITSCLHYSQNLGSCATDRSSSTGKGVKPII